jgi:hypothetical protein
MLRFCGNLTAGILTVKYWTVYLRRTLVYSLVLQPEIFTEEYKEYKETVDGAAMQLYSLDRKVLLPERGCAPTTTLLCCASNTVFFIDHV